MTKVIEFEVQKLYKELPIARARFIDACQSL